MIKILNEREKQKIEKSLKEQFGISEIPGKILMLGAERLFIFTGKLSDEELKKIELSAPVDKMGCYFAKINGEDEDIKLTIEGTQILKEQITKNIFEINGKDAEEWMMGRELNIKTGLRGFIVIKNKETGDLLGCGKASENKITNFIPKSRRLKNKV